MDEIIKKMKVCDYDLNKIFEHNQEAFIRHEEEVMKRLQEKMNSYLDRDIRYLLLYYLIANGPLVCGDIIIDLYIYPGYSTKLLRFRLKDIEDFEILFHQHNDIKLDEPFTTEHWKTTDSLKSVDNFIECVDKFKSYELFEVAIENCIERIYDHLGNWKEKSSNERAAKLKKISAQLSVETDCN